MSFFRSIYFTILLYKSLALADRTFKSRPDLAPPRLNITIPANGAVEAGYIFIAPYNFQGHIKNRGPLQAAPYIFTSAGELVWSGYSYFSEWSGNFQVVRWKGANYLAAAESTSPSLHGHGHGHFKLLDQHYQFIRQLQAGHHELADIHEFSVVDEKTALIEIYHPLQRNLGSFGGSQEQTWIIDPRFQEFDISTGRVLFEWRGLDYVSPHESVLHLTSNPEGTADNSSTAWDYFHLNSVTKSHDGHYLISARHTSTLYKINGTSGSIIWRLGGRLSNFTLGQGVSFGGQHHARYISESTDIETISLFDNSGHGPDQPPSPSDTSLGKYIELNHLTKTAKILHSFAPPPNHSLLAVSQGSLQTLPNENVLINWGSEGAITEYNSSGAPLFHAFLDSGSLFDGVQNYRAFKFHWTGRPFEEPAIEALYDEASDETHLYVSWNGDTETKAWRFYALSGQRYGRRNLLGESERVGFETVLRVKGGVGDKFDAEAVGGNEKVLGRTRTVAMEVDFGATTSSSDVGLVVQN